MIRLCHLLSPQQAAENKTYHGAVAVLRLHTRTHFLWGHVQMV